MVLGGWEGWHGCQEKALLVQKDAGKEGEAVNSQDP